MFRLALLTQLPPLPFFLSSRVLEATKMALDNGLSICRKETETVGSTPYTTYSIF